eukprot:10276508-Heterocapsa_arctica.AAC.1
MKQEPKMEVPVKESVDRTALVDAAREALRVHRDAAAGASSNSGGPARAFSCVIDLDDSDGEEMAAPAPAAAAEEICE